LISSISSSLAWRGLLLTIAGATLISFETLLLRLVQADLWTVIWWRGVLLGTTMLIGLVPRRSFRALLLRGSSERLAVIGFAAAISCFVAAIQNTTVANTLVIGSAAPFMATILSWTLLRERQRALTWITVLVLVAGLAIIFHDSLRLNHLLGDAFALGYAACLGAYFVALRRARADAFAAIIGYGGLLSALIASPFAAPLTLSSDSFLFILLLGVLVVPLATLLLAKGTQHLAAPDVTLIMMLETILGPLWVWMALGELPDGATFAGGALIIATVVAHAYAAARRPAATNPQLGTSATR